MSEQGNALGAKFTRGDAHLILQAELLDVTTATRIAASAHSNVPITSPVSRVPMAVKVFRLMA